jgi:GrpB-like predicted nucleotidyltransferase (UPF0157 family)
MKEYKLHQQLTPYTDNWIQIFQAEKVKLKENLQEFAIQDIQHIGSTSIPNIKSKPIIDIAILTKYQDNYLDYTKRLVNLGYTYDEQASSTERYFYRKYNQDIGFHLSIAFCDRGSFWERQIMFRDYLIQHPFDSKEYEKLKEKAIEEDPSGKANYISAKNKFIADILSKAKID